ncbi:unnamed protein product, partial [Nesidiocoris tenuis]
MDRSPVPRGWSRDCSLDPGLEQSASRTTQDESTTEASTTSPTVRKPSTTGLLRLPSGQPYFHGAEST